MFGLVKKWLARRGEEPFFCSAVVPAAGASSRMGGQNKLFAPVDGVPVLVRSVLALSRAMGALARGDSRQAAAGWYEMRDLICKNEQKYQPYLDVYRILEVTRKYTGFPLTEE